MFEKIYDIIEYAVKKSRHIADKIHWKKGEDMKKDDINIQSYEGEDAFYTGTDKEYEEFLKNSNIKMNADVQAEAVENTQKINLNETINIQSVIDKFKKTAGGIESGAKRLKETVINKVDEFKAKKENSSVLDDVFGTSEHSNDAVNESSVKEKMKNTIKNSVNKFDDVKESVVSISGMSNKFDKVETDINYVSKDISDLTRKVDELSEKVKVIEIQETERMKDHNLNYSDLKSSVNEVSTEVSEIKQAINSVSKLTDSIFDLKNSQMNTKNVLSDLETSLVRLKKKCVMGVTILSVLSAIVIVLQIVLMLS